MITFSSPNAWLLSRVLFDIVPLRLIPIIIVSTIVYWMVGLSPHADRFFKFLLILVEYGLQLSIHVSRRFSLGFTFDIFLLNRISSWPRSFGTEGLQSC
jgi:hypothetical protein